MPAISVIVINWNGKHFLDTCLSALRRQTFTDFEVILVDNGSEDGSVEFVRTTFPEVQIVALPTNLGFTGGNIAGWQKSTGDIIILLNNDTEAHPDWLAEVHQGALEYPTAGSFASKMLLFNDRDRIDNCGFAMTSGGVSIDLGRGELDGPKWRETSRVFGACGGAAIYRRKMLDEVGFLDNDFFMTYEDLDLSFRAQLRGYECIFLPKAIVYHRYRATMQKYPARQVYFSQRNLDFVYLKNMPAGMMLRFFLFKLLCEVGSAAYFIRQGNFRPFLSAKFEVFSNLFRILEKRREIQRTRTLSNLELQNVLLRDGWLLLKVRKFFSGLRRGSETAQVASRKTNLSGKAGVEVQ